MPKPLKEILGATLLLALASISVALYYNITFFGKAVIALPSFPIAAGCLVYYLAAFNTTPPVAQVLLWISSFIVCGWLWWWALDRVVRQPRMANNPTSSATRRRLVMALLPYLLPLPWLLWVHAQSAAGPSLQALRAAILVRDNLYWNSQGSENILNALYVGLALAETSLTFFALRTAQLSASRAAASMLLAGLGSMVVLCALAELGFRLH